MKKEPLKKMVLTKETVANLLLNEVSGGVSAVGCRSAVDGLCTSSAQPC
jgi:hypothetical protein